MINHALTAGYATAFEVAALIAFAGLLVALAAIRGRRTAVTRESEVAAASRRWSGTERLLTTPAPIFTVW